jgi:hypothetical protein
LLAPVSAGQVDIDVGPLAAFFRKKAFKQQIHADRIYSGDPERVTDRAVRCRTAALHQDAVTPAEFDNVPND